jgi:signal transduction histidine kinase
MMSEDIKIKIILVDDEELILGLFRSVLQTQGYEVDIAVDGQQALQLCAENDYHIMITDLNMPNMDGMALLKRVKDRWPMMEVIVVTGYGTMQTAIEAMKVGASDFIIKPVNFEQVQFTIQRCVHKIKAAMENQELREINAQLRSVNELKDKFLAITNHEIRTPLTIIKGYMEILEMIVDAQDPEVAETLEILKNTTNELSQTVERMHLLNQANQVSLRNRPEKTDLKTLLESVCEKMRRLFDYRKIEFKVKIPDKSIVAYGSAKKLRIILQELLQNALKFTPEGGNVEVFCRDGENEVAVVVKDTGIGIPYDKQELIFTGFYEVQDSINHKSGNEEFMGGGMGIGLRLVKELVTALNGRIELLSEPGRGSVFKVVLPKSVEPVSV